MILAVPIAWPQLWLFWGFALVFVGFVFRAMQNRRKEGDGGRSDPRSRWGIILQSVGIAAAGFGPARPTLAPLSPAALASDAAVVLLMGGAVALFASSSVQLGKNWSLQARTRADHELVRTGPYAHVRHPIYLAMLLFLLGLTASLGHWVQLVIAIPLFLMGTRMRTHAEDRLLEESFGDQFRAYRSATPAIVPRLL